MTKIHPQEDPIDTSGVVLPGVPKVSQPVPYDLRDVVRHISTTEGGDTESAILEILLDVRHFCDANRLDFHRLIENSYQAYLESKQGTTKKHLRESYRMK